MALSKESATFCLRLQPKTVDYCNLRQKLLIHTQRQKINPYPQCYVVVQKANISCVCKLAPARRLTQTKWSLYQSPVAKPLAPVEVRNSFGHKNSLCKSLFLHNLCVPFTSYGNWKYQYSSWININNPHIQCQDPIFQQKVPLSPLLSPSFEKKASDFFGDLPIPSI